MTVGASGSAQGKDRGFRRLGFRLPVWLPARLGIGSGLAHPGRAAMTTGALVVGVAAVTLSIGLNSSLLLVKTTLDRAEASPVRAQLDDPSVDPNGVAGVIASQPDTAVVDAIDSAQVGVPAAGLLPFVGYDGDSSGLGYALIQGRWFSGPGEAVAPTNVFRQTGLRLGDDVTLTDDGRSVTVRLVGETFEAAGESRDNLVIRGSWADLVALDPGATPASWEVRPRDGVDARAFAEDLRVALPGVDVSYVGESHFDESFALFLAVVGIMGIVLTVISLGGVFNTVLLETRQRSPEIAVLKAIGLRPLEVTAMVLSSIVPIGLIAGVVGVPLGIVAQHAVLTYMGEVAAKTTIPPSIFDVFSTPLLIGLALTGLAIGVIGAWVPAQRAARGRIAPVLQAE
jgi:putative ABC transport system permease protein